MNGYVLSRRAAEVELRQAASRGKMIEAKSVLSLTSSLEPGRQDGDNFRTNKVTMEYANDFGAAITADAVGLSATWACVSFWAGNIASLPIAIQRRGDGGVPVDDIGHPLYWLLHDSPNYDQSAFDFWEFIVASIELRGNAYAEIRRSGDRIVSLTPIPPASMQVRRLRTGELEYTWRDSVGEYTRLQGDILHIRGFGGGPLGGVSPLTVCRQTFASAVAVDRASATVFSNGVRPSGVMSTDKALNPEQRALAEGLLVDKFTGAINAGRPMLLDNGVKWEQLSIDPQDAEMLDSRRFSVEDICRVFEVDPHMVGQTTGNTMLGSSIAEQTLSVLKFKMRKRLKRIEGALSKQLLTRADRQAGISIKFNVEAFLRADSVGRSSFYGAALDKGWMTINEVRSLEGLPPVAGGETPRMQMQNVPITQAGQQPAGVVQ